MSRYACGQCSGTGRMLQDRGETMVLSKCLACDDGIVTEGTLPRFLIMKAAGELRTRREERKMSVLHFAQLAGTTGDQVSRWETGIDPCSDAVLEVYARVLRDKEVSA